MLIGSETGLDLLIMSVYFRKGYQHHYDSTWPVFVSQAGKEVEKTASALSFGRRRERAVSTGLDTTCRGSKESHSDVLHSFSTLPIFNLEALAAFKCKMFEFPDFLLIMAHVFILKGRNVLCFHTCTFQFCSAFITQRTG